MGRLFDPLGLFVVERLLRLFEFNRQSQVLENNEKLNKDVLTKGDIVQL